MKIMEEEIMGELQCSSRFRCAESGFEVLGRARRFGLEEYLECLESDPPKCKFASRFLGTYRCKCPVRAYVFENLKN